MSLLRPKIALEKSLSPNIFTGKCTIGDPTEERNPNLDQNSVALSVVIPTVFLLCVLVLSISIVWVLYKRFRLGHRGDKRSPRVLSDSDTDLGPATLPPRVVNVTPIRAQQSLYSVIFLIQNSSNCYSISLNTTNTVRTGRSSVQCSVSSLCNNYCGELTCVHKPISLQNPLLILHKENTHNLETSQPSYNYIDDSGWNPPDLVQKRGPLPPEPNYEFDSEATSEEGPYWEPSNIEEELRAYLNKSGVLDIPKDSIQYVVEHR